MSHIPTILLAEGNASVFKTEALLLKVLLQLIVIIVAARVFAALFRRFRQPAVVGEIVGGLLLGPSCFGALFPQLSASVFDPSLGSIFGVLSQVGLILLLFVVGLEFDFSHLRGQGRSAVAISLTGIALPLGLGAVWALLVHSRLASEQPDVSIPKLGFVLFMGTAISVTAIPVLGRIMLELNITRTRLGAVTISAAAVDDACGWILLATISSIVRAQFDPWISLRMILETVGFTVALLWIVRPLMQRYLRSALKRDGDLKPTSLAVVLVVMFLAAMATSTIGIFAIFGAFLLGTALSGEVEFRNVFTRHMRDFLTVFFLPIFFTYTGLRTNIGTLTSWADWLMLGTMLACAVAGKLGGCWFAARSSGFPSRDAVCIGALMNTRGLMGLVVSNVGRDLGVIPDSVFCMLAITAIVTTFMTTPLLLHYMRGTELEPFIHASDCRQTTDE